MAYNVLHCLARMNRGGAETLIMNIFRHIDRDKYKFYFLLNDDKCDYTEEIKQLGGHIYCVPPRSNGIISNCKALDKFFKEHEGQFDAVHMHTSSLSSLEVLFYAKKHGIKKRIIHSHNTVQAGVIHNILHWLNKPWVRFLATDYLACSKVASDWLYNYTGVSKKAIVINNGIDIKQFEYNENYRSEIRRKHNINQTAVVIGHVGRFDVVKNHTFLVEIFKCFTEKTPQSYLLCVGVGGSMDQVKEKVHRYALDDKVIFAGLQSEIYKYLSAFDYFVFPSLYEGLPVALVEAQASGAMTVCSDKVSHEACLSDYITQFGLEQKPEEWAKYLGGITLLDRRKFVFQLEEKGYNINKTIQYLTENIYI